MLPSGVFGRTKFRSRIDHINVELRRNSTLCCIRDVEFFFAPEVYAYGEGEEVIVNGFNKVVTPGRLGIILDHENMHVEHFEALGNGIMPIVEMQCNGKCWRRGTCGNPWTYEKCYVFLEAKMAGILIR
jgi:hypothetical protein